MYSNEGMDQLKRVRYALAQTVKASVQMWPRAEWNAGLQAGGDPTLLERTFDPYLGIEGSTGFVGAVASGTDFTASQGGTPGLHHVREDLNDPPEGRINTYTDEVIEDLPADERWPEVLRIAGLDDTGELRKLVRAYVFGYRCLRDDHWSSAIPKDIAKAKRKVAPPDADG